MSVPTSTALGEAGRRLGRVSPQRWSLSFAAMTAAATAAIVAGVAAGAVSLLPVMLVAGVAGLAVIHPHTHTALAVFVVAVWYWLAAVDDPVTPWTVAFALALVVFHAVVALLATGGATVAIDAVSLRRWAARLAAVAVSVPATWGLVALLDRRSAPGSALLTAAAFAVVVVSLLALRWSLGDRPSTGDDAQEGS